MKKIYLVIEEAGSYSDYSKSNLYAYENKEDADQEVERLNNLVMKQKKLNMSLHEEIFKPGREKFDKEWAKQTYHPNYNSPDYAPYIKPLVDCNESLKSMMNQKWIEAGFELPMTFPNCYYSVEEIEIK